MLLFWADIRVKVTSLSIIGRTREYILHGRITGNQYKVCSLQLGREWRGCGGGLLRLLLSERGRRVIGLPCPEAWWSLSIGGSGGGWGSMQGLRRDRRSWRQKLAVGKGHPAFRHSWVPPSALPFPSLPPALRSV